MGFEVNAGTNCSRFEVHTFQPQVPKHSLTWHTTHSPLSLLLYSVFLSLPLPLCLAVCLVESNSQIRCLFWTWYPGNFMVWFKFSLSCSIITSQNGRKLVQLGATTADICMAIDGKAPLSINGMCWRYQFCCDSCSCRDSCCCCRCVIIVVINIVVIVVEIIVALSSSSSSLLIDIFVTAYLANFKTIFVKFDATTPDSTIFTVPQQCLHWSI